MNSPVPSRAEIGVVIVAAGKGTRLGGTAKQFRPLGGVPLLLHTLRPFTSHPEIGAIVVVLAPDVCASPPDWLMGLIGVRLSLVPGGVERADSVRAGVAALPASCSIVLIHDGARPFPQRAVIDGVIDACRAGEAAIAALPMHDTVKEAQPRPDGMHVTRRTVPRDHLWRAQTPQGFPRQLLERAYAERGDAVTDDAQAVERLGHDVVLIHDSTLNLKVTTADDLALAEALVEARK